jgi:hypothetical protein
MMSQQIVFSRRVSGRVGAACAARADRPTGPSSRSRPRRQATELVRSRLGGRLRGKGDSPSAGVEPRRSGEVALRPSERSRRRTDVLLGAVLERRNLVVRARVLCDPAAASRPEAVEGAGTDSRSCSATPARSGQDGRRGDDGCSRAASHGPPAIMRIDPEGDFDGHSERSVHRERRRRGDGHEQKRMPGTLNERGGAARCAASQAEGRRSVASFGTAPVSTDRPNGLTSR